MEPSWAGRPSEGVLEEDERKHAPFVFPLLKKPFAVAVFTLLHAVGAVHALVQVQTTSTDVPQLRRRSALGAAVCRLLNRTSVNVPFDTNIV